MNGQSQNQPQSPETSPNRTRKVKRVSPTMRMFCTPGPGAYFPEVNLETEKEIFKRTHSPDFQKTKHKEPSVAMLPYMVGYKALAKQQGQSLASKQGIDYQQREMSKVPSPHRYVVKSPTRTQTRLISISPRIEYRGLVVPDDF